MKHNLELNLELMQTTKIIRSNETAVICCEVFCYTAESVCIVHLYGFRVVSLLFSTCPQSVMIIWRTPFALGSFAAGMRMILSAWGWASPLWQNGCWTEKFGPSYAAAMKFNELEFHFMRCHEGAPNLWTWWLKTHFKSTLKKKKKKTAPKPQWEMVKMHYSCHGCVFLFL